MKKSLVCGDAQAWRRTHECYLAARMRLFRGDPRRFWLGCPNWGLGRSGMRVRIICRDCQAVKGRTVFKCAARRWSASRWVASVHDVVPPHLLDTGPSARACPPDEKATAKTSAGAAGGLTTVVLKGKPFRKRRAFLLFEFRSVFQLSRSANSHGIIRRIERGKCGERGRNRTFNLLMER